MCCLWTAKIYATTAASGDEYTSALRGLYVLWYYTSSIQPVQYTSTLMILPCVKSSNQNHLTLICMFLINLLKWTESNDMQLNASKTKEMILGPLAKSNLPLLSTTVGTIDRVTSFKLLGVHIDSTLSWTTHVNHIIKKLPQGFISLNNLKEQDFLLVSYSIITQQS